MWQGRDSSEGCGAGGEGGGWGADSSDLFQLVVAPGIP